MEIDIITLPLISRSASGLAFASVLAALVFLHDGRKSIAGELEEIKSQIIDLQNKGKLGVRDMVLSRQIYGYGSYEPYQNNVMSHDATAYVYFEPVNFFTNTMVDPDGALLSPPNPVAPGSYVEMEALMDLVCIISSCPFDLKIEGWSINAEAGPSELEVSVR